MSWLIAGGLIFHVSAEARMVWTDARDVGVSGRAQFNSSRALYYDRLPAEAAEKVRPNVWYTSRTTAGMYVQFKTCSSILSVNVTYLYADLGSWNFLSTGWAGLDLYAWDTATTSWHWLATTLNMSYPTFVSNLTISSSTGTSRYRLHLPLYNGVTELLIGHTTTCPLERDDTKYPQIVWYGTSITQGATTSRPGLTFTHSIARRIHHDVLNFGFSSGCLMDLEVARYLVQIPDPVLFVIDCNWNMDSGQIREKLAPLVHYLRSHHIRVPIVIAEDTLAGDAWLIPDTSGQMQKRTELRAAYDKLVSLGERDLHYVYREQLFPFTAVGDKLMSPTSDGLHPTDIGMQAIADFYVGFLPPILAQDLKFPAEVSKPSSLESQAAEWGFDRYPVGGDVADFSAGGWDWTNISKLGVMGRAFNDTPTIFNRLPARAKGLVSDDVWRSSLDSTGLFVAFDTDATVIALYYNLTSDSSSLWHMPTSSTSGVDLYRFDEASGVWGFLSNLKWNFPANGQPVMAALTNHMPKLEEPSHYLLFLPLRKEVAWGAIGVKPGSSTPRRNGAFATDGITVNGRKPILWFGNSIAQVGAASRSGGIYTNILTRNLGRVILNMDFAGSENTESSVFEFLTEIDAEIIVIEFLWNTPAASLRRMTGPVIKYIRQIHQHIPIVLAEGGYSVGNGYPSSFRGSAALRAEYDKLLSTGIEYLYLVERNHNELFASKPSVTPTIDGFHLTDLGHREIAKFYTHYLQNFPPNTTTTTTTTTSSAFSEDLTGSASGVSATWKAGVALLLAWKFCNALH